MADRRISQLSEISSSVASDILPIVSSGATSKITVSNLLNNTLSSSAQIADDISGSLSATAIADLGAGLISQSSNLIDIPGVQIQYSNVYSNLGDLPSANNYHGMFAHVHATGKGYFAHAGNWVELANNSNLISSSAQISTDISGAFTSTSASLASDIAGITTFTTDGTGILSSSVQIATNISGAFNDNHLATTGSNTFRGNQTISGSQLLTLQPSHPLPSSATVGSFAVTGSDVAFYDGANWKKIVTGSF